MLHLSQLQTNEGLEKWHRWKLQLATFPLEGKNKENQNQANKLSYSVRCPNPENIPALSKGALFSGIGLLNDNLFARFGSLRLSFQNRL